MGENKVTNQEFFETWKKVCNKNEKMLIKLSDFPTDYTNLILKNDNCIIEQIADKFGMETSPEYYQIDAVLCKQSDYFQCQSEHKTWGARTGYWLNQIRVAFEHENNLKSAYQEIAHLLTTNAVTKILVTYAEKEKTGNHAKDFCKLIDNLDSYEPYIMVIFGCYNKTENKYEWIGYELKKDGPNEILCD